MKIDELKLVIYQLENEIIKMKSLNDIKHNNFTHLEKKEFDSQNVYQNKKKMLVLINFFTVFPKSLNF